MRRYQATAALMGASVVAGAVGWSMFSASSLAIPDEGKSDSRDPKGRPSERWLTGTTEERFAQIEQQLRGLDKAMAEIGYRYGELLSAAKSENWEYAQYQTEKIALSMRLALERRPKRAESAQHFLDESLPPVMAAIAARDGDRLGTALDGLYSGCVQCHRDENVLHFREAVDRIKARSQSE